MSIRVNPRFDTHGTGPGAESLKSDGSVPILNGVSPARRGRHPAPAVGVIAVVPVTLPP